MIDRRKALQIDPPAVPSGKQKCPCCSGPLGAKSWEMAICLTCYDIKNGNRTDAVVFSVAKSQGGFSIVRFARKHTTCFQGMGFHIDSLGKFCR